MNDKERMELCEDMLDRAFHLVSRVQEDHSDLFGIISKKALDRVLPNLALLLTMVRKRLEDYD